MARRNLDREIQKARDEILLLGSLVECATLSSVGALRDHDLQRSSEILDEDETINKKRYTIEGSIISTIAIQQPTARDLRILASILDVCSELERMGDYAKGIATINLRSGGLSMPKVLRDLHYMAQKDIDMLHRALTAFVNEDDTVAAALIKEDDVIDALYQQIYFEMMDFVAENPHDIERTNYVLWAAHNLERMADRITNICERTIFIRTGEISLQGIERI